MEAATGPPVYGTEYWTICAEISAEKIERLVEWLFQMHPAKSGIFVSVGVEKLAEPMTPKEVHDEEYGEWLTKEEKFHLDNAKAGLVLENLDWCNGY